MHYATFLCTKASGIYVKPLVVFGKWDERIVKLPRALLSESEPMFFDAYHIGIYDEHTSRYVDVGFLSWTELLLHGDPSRVVKDEDSMIDPLYYITIPRSEFQAMRSLSAWPKLDTPQKFDPSFTWSHLEALRGFEPGEVKLDAPFHTWTHALSMEQANHTPLPNDPATFFLLLFVALSFRPAAIYASLYHALQQRVEYGLASLLRKALDWDLMMALLGSAGGTQLTKKQIEALPFVKRAWLPPPVYVFDPWEEHVALVRPKNVLRQRFEPGVLHQGRLYISPRHVLACGSAIVSRLVFAHLVPFPSPLFRKSEQVVTRPDGIRPLQWKELRRNLGAAVRGTDFAYVPLMQLPSDARIAKADASQAKKILPPCMRALQIMCDQGTAGEFKDRILIEAYCRNAGLSLETATVLFYAKRPDRQGFLKWRYTQAGRTPDVSCAQMHCSGRCPGRADCTQQSPARESIARAAARLDW